MRYERVFPAFSIAFCILYVLCLAFHWQPFIYYPLVNELHRTARPAIGPPMSWYGWIAASILGGTIAGAISLVLPTRATDRLWSILSLVVPPVASLVLVFLSRDWFFK